MLGTGKLATLSSSCSTRFHQLARIWGYCIRCQAGAWVTFLSCVRKVCLLIPHILDSTYLSMTRSLDMEINLTFLLGMFQIAMVELQSTNQKSWFAVRGSFYLHAICSVCSSDFSDLYWNQTLAWSHSFKFEFFLLFGVHLWGMMSDCGKHMVKN